MDEQPGDFGPTWVLLRVLPTSNEHPGTPAVRMRRALKGLLRGYGIRVEQLAACAPDGWPAGIRPPKWPRP